MLAPHDPALFWRQVDTRIGAIGASDYDTRRLCQFASVTFDALRGSCGSARLAAGQECDAPFPGLRSEPWWDSRAFEWAEAVEAGAAVMGAELDRFEASAASADGLWTESVTALCSDTAGFAKLALREDGDDTAVGRSCFRQTLGLLHRSWLRPSLWCHSSPPWSPQLAALVAMIEVWKMGPGNLKQMITEWYTFLPTFAGLKVDEWCVRLQVAPWWLPPAQA